MTTETKGPDTLVQKLAAVMAQVERVPKNGWNDFHKYHYATEADLSDAVRSSLARFGVMLIPTVDKLEWREVQGKNGTEKIATLTVRFTATDGKDKLEFTVIGEGQDRGDKATYKAMTGATKYALLKLFLIPTGDDPEKDEEEKPRPRPAKDNGAAAAAKMREAVKDPKGRIQAVIAWAKKHGRSRADLGKIMGRLIPDGQPFEPNSAELQSLETAIALADAAAVSEARQ